jgi:hypothetical protein
MNTESLKRKNFSPEEFFASTTACERNINNTIDDPDILINLNFTASKMQEIRNLLEAPIRISSAYRCLDLNRALGSKDTSQHILGQACDFVCPSYGTPKQIIHYLKKNNIEVDQCLCEGSWLHVSIKKEGNRNEFAYFLKDENGVRRKEIIT